VLQIKHTYTSTHFAFRFNSSHLFGLQIESVPTQVLSGDQELEVLAEASGFVAEGTEQSKEIAPN